MLGLAKRLVDGFDAPAHRTKPELIEGDRRALELWFDDPSKFDGFQLARWRHADHKDVPLFNAQT